MKLAETWYEPPASEQELALMKRIAPAAVAFELDRFFRKHNGAERAFVDVDYATDRFDCLRIDNIALLTDPDVRRSLDDCFPGYWAIGGDAGGQILAYAMLSEVPWPLVLILPGDADPPTVLARSLDELSEKYFRPDQ
ncbi:hypothetical protein BH11VER1_BH11VER1_39570 [soil metagenome]